MSPQVRRVAELMVTTGMSNKEMGAALGVTEKTLKIYASRALRALKARSRVELMAREIAGLRATLNARSFWL